MRVLRKLLVTIATVSGFAAGASAATVTIVNLDGLGEGFNDATAATPVGGNPGTTLGAQRLFVFQTAASIWGALLPSPVEIRVQSAFNALFCDGSSAVLGGANAISVAANFSGAELGNTNYHIALANRLAGSDLSGGNDINIQFNSALDGGACLGGATWYYGIDGNEPPGQVELLPVVLHELAHGLGFSQFANLSTGVLLNSRPDVYGHHLRDNTVGLTWSQMSNTQRVASAVNTGNVVFEGTATSTRAPLVLGPRVEVRVGEPPAIAGTKAFGTAQFGPDPSAQTVSGELVLVDDGVAPTDDACTPLVNAAQVSGRIALIRRGTCSFLFKAQKAAAAGAIAVVIANNATGSPPQMGGSDPSLQIPTVSVTQADGDALMGALLGGTVTMTIGPNPAKFAGADDAGRPLVYAPNPIQQGSSISHFDVSTSPDLLMEPFINDELSGSVDLTRDVFEDLGWIQPRVTAVGDAAAAAGLRFAGVRPNPVPGAAAIAFTLANEAEVAIDVFDPAGRIVSRLTPGTLPAGPHALEWDARGVDGGRLGAGVYFLRIQAGTERAVRRAVVLAPR